MADTPGKLSFCAQSSHREDPFAKLFELGELVLYNPFEMSQGPLSCLRSSQDPKQLPALPDSPILFTHLCAEPPMIQREKRIFKSLSLSILWRNMAELPRGLLF